MYCIIVAYLEILTIHEHAFFYVVVGRSWSANTTMALHGLELGFSNWYVVTVAICDSIRLYS